MLEICKRKGRLKWFVKQPYPPLAQVVYSSRICSEYLCKKKEEKLTLEDQVFRLILRINSSELCNNVYGNANTYMIYLSSFLPTAFPSMKFIENSVLREETFVARRKMAFWERKLLLLGEKWRFWTGNFCCSVEIRIFLYFQDLASFHRKKNHGSRYLPWIYFFSSSPSKLWIRV